MLLLMLLGAGITIPVRAYAAISFALNNDGALGFSLVGQANGTVQ